MKHLSRIILLYFLISVQICLAEIEAAGIATQIAAGRGHTCAIYDGKVYCWGNGGTGQLGNYSFTSSAIPHPILDPLTESYTGLLHGKAAIKIAAGDYFSCAINSSNDLYCWGINGSGQLGIGTTTSKHTPQPIGEAKFKDIALGATMSCGIDNSDKLWCWGGSFGNVPTDMFNGSNRYATKVAVGDGHICMIDKIAGNITYCWGDNSSGQLGLGNYDEPGVFSAIFDAEAEYHSGLLIGASVSSIWARGNNTYIWNSGSLLYGVGAQDMCQLTAQHSTCGGYGDKENTFNRVGLYAEPISAGYEHSCGMGTIEGYVNKLLCWGRNDHGQVGTGLVTTLEGNPAKVGGTGTLGSDWIVSAVAAGDSFTCAIANSKVFCWGRNNSGQIGTGTATDVDILVPYQITEVIKGDGGGGDLCPEDPLKTVPGVCGCGVADTDSDGDETPDCHDSCPYNAPKTAPGACGCDTADTDSDGDETPDCNDLCSTDPSKTAPGQCGCGMSDLDSDGDGTADCHDGCMSDPNKTAPGLCGCGTVEDAGDTDGDSTINCKDGCPSDPNKTAPGLCGCGNEDIEGCGGVEDLCPTDPNKTEPGVCGCEVADTDTDGDGTLDCKEECDSDPYKTGPGLCGCGNEDVAGCGAPPCVSDINFSKIDTACDNGKSGSCKKEGKYICDGGVVKCNADPNEGCSAVVPTPTSSPTTTPTINPTLSPEEEFDPYDSHMENPPAVENGKAPLKPYKKETSNVVTIYFQWFSDFFLDVKKLLAFIDQFIVKAPSKDNDLKKNVGPAVKVEQGECKIFENRTQLQNALRKCKQKKVTVVRVNKNQTVKCKTVKQCGGFSASAKRVFALKTTKNRVITANKMKKLAKKGKEPNAIKIKVKKNTHYNVRYRIVNINKKGKIKNVTPYSSPVTF